MAKQAVPSPLSMSRRASKRSPNDAEERENDASRREAFRNRSHSLRISASEVAALAGFNRYRSLPTALFEQVYQGRDGYALLRHDAKLLGMYLTTREDIMVEIAQTAGPATLEVVRSALKVKDGSKKLASARSASDLKKKVVNEAIKSKRLTKSQHKQLKETAFHLINTGFGTTWEDRALDEYELRNGCEVRERNAEIRTWPFQKACRNGEPTIEPMGPAYNSQQIATENMDPSTIFRGTKRRRNSGENQQPPPSQNSANVIDLTEEAGSADAVVNTGTSILQGGDNDDYHGERPFLCIRGAIDGVCDELVPSDNNVGAEDVVDDASWVLRRVIVECKHRMNRIQPSPPLYECIQATVYCFMYAAQEVDIVQVLRVHPEESVKRKGAARNIKSSENDVSPNCCPKSEGSPSETEGSLLAISMADSTNDAPTNQPKSRNGKGRLQKASSEKLGISDENGNDTSDADEDKTAFQIAVNRVSLYDPVYQHAQNLIATVLPRLRSWADAVYSVRRSDDKRYRLLQALADPPRLDLAWRIVIDECPWLEHCDTSYQQDIQDM